MTQQNPDDRTGTPSTGPQSHSQGTAESKATSASDHEAPYKPKYKPLWNNFITMCGIFLVIMAILGLLTFGLFSLVSRDANPYVDIFGYLVIPSILILGVLVIPFGILFKSWRLHRRNPQERLAFRFPHFDLNDPAQRRAAKFVVGGTFVLLPLVGVSSYHGYHFTDSSRFCAKACHAAMKPQATTYEHSAHARVGCADCHIGSGASWFVKSKLSGTRQVIAMWRDSFPRPIPPGITELRPARETCEECHWPKKFFGAQLAEIIRFASDEKNTRREIDMLLKIGGGDETTGPAEGIHKHMALEGRIEYIATDDRLQDIPWVKLTDEAGNELIYRSDGRPSSDPEPEGQVRQLDCMDCHNRPAHRFRSPQEAVDVYLNIGNIDTTLPYVKREATRVLVQGYADVDAAQAQIGVSLAEFYRTNYPEIWRTRKASINGAIDKVRDIYLNNFFPEMNVDWRTYPDNIGHKISPGCFRCHEGRHVNQYGEVISHECSVCHTFLNPVVENGKTQYIQQGEFVHSMKLEGPHAELRCDQCHTGGLALDPTCSGCHTIQAEFLAGTLADFESFGIEADPMADLDCTDCHDPLQPADPETITGMCLDCHDDDQERYAGLLPQWRREAEQLLSGAEAKADARGKRLLQTLRQAGPSHNIEAARIIARALAGKPLTGGGSLTDGQTTQPVEQ